MPVARGVPASLPDPCATQGLQAHSSLWSQCQSQQSQPTVAVPHDTQRTHACHDCARIGRGVCTAGDWSRSHALSTLPYRAFDHRLSAAQADTPAGSTRDRTTRCLMRSQTPWQDSQWWSQTQPTMQRHALLRPIESSSGLCDPLRRRIFKDRGAPCIAAAPTNSIAHASPSCSNTHGPIHSP